MKRSTYLIAQLFAGFGLALTCFVGAKEWRAFGLVCLTVGGWDLIRGLMLEIVLLGQRSRR
jgi:hypothetical protein